jgi:hypothetical protein
MSPRWARAWFAVTALCVAAGVALSAYTAVKIPGHFPTGVERGFNTFAFFTVDSNLIVGGTTTLLAIRPDRPSVTFRTFRLIGLDARLGPRRPDAAPAPQTAGTTAGPPS